MDSGKSPEVYNVGGARAKNGEIPDILRSAYRKFSCKPVVPMESVYSKGVLLGVTTH